MSNCRIIAVKRGALPSAPLQPGQARGGVISQDYAPNEDSMYATCRDVIKAGCRVTVTTPNGEERSHEEILAALQARGELN